MSRGEKDTIRLISNRDPAGFICIIERKEMIVFLREARLCSSSPENLPGLGPICLPATYSAIAPLNRFDQHPFVHLFA